MLYHQLLHPLPIVPELIGINDVYCSEEGQKKYTKEMISEEKKCPFFKSTFLDLDPVF